jgi:hypothetical protein
MRLLDKTFLTQDEQYGPASAVASKVEVLLKRLTMDTYNHQYVIRITVDVVDDVTVKEDEDED